MKLTGELSFPGDKSISHRALMLAALSEGKCTIKNLSTGKDVESTHQCLLSCSIESQLDNGKIRITGKPLQNPSQILDCGNSGTTARLLAGLLAGQKVTATLEGDHSLSSRPMNRIIDPLSKMGADVDSSDGYLPLNLIPRPLHGIQYTPPISSAQVKSAVILAGLGAEGETTLIEPIKTRDHTERMLKTLGGSITLQGSRITVSPLQQPLETFELTIPGDPSTAAYFAAAATLIPNSELRLINLLANPTRTGFFTVLEKMGASIEILSKNPNGGEEVHNLKISPGALTGITLSPEQIPTIIDELPILAIVATQAEGRTVVTGASELRVKECDRLQAICKNLHRMGAKITELLDGFVITGPTSLHQARISTYNDHRIAMAFTIASLIADGPVTIDNSTCMEISCPDFKTMLQAIIR